MRRILYIHQYFKTPKESGAIRSYHIAKGMVKRGHHVDMITGGNGRSYQLEVVEGIMVHRLPIAYTNNYSFLKRSISFVKFVSSSLALIGKLPKSDLVYATSTPLTVGIISLWLKWKKNISYVFEVRDLWPEAPIQLGVIRSRAIKFLLKKLEKKIYLNASRIVALSPGIKEGILAVDNSLQVDVIPNMSDVSFFDPISTSEKRTFTIGYFGTFGIANDINFILEIAHHCHQEKLPIEFLLIGEGSEKGTIELKAHELGLRNITFFEHVNRIAVREYLSKVDASITCFQDRPILQTNSPNKFFDGLAAGKLMIVNTKGWLKDLVEENDCGFYIDPDETEEFTTLILPYLSNQSLLIEARKNSRRLAENQFPKDPLVEQVCDLLPES